MAILGAGATLNLLIASTYTPLSEVTKISGPGITVGDVDVTHLTAANMAKIFLPGWIDGGTVRFECNFTASGIAVIMGVIRTMSSWRILFSNGSKFDLSGYWNNYDDENPLEEEVTVSVAIKVSGLPTFTQ